LKVLSSSFQGVSVLSEFISQANQPIIPKSPSARAQLSLTPISSEVPGRVARAATALFAKQGYHGTSTREIARLADVSEVTVFRYFDHKEDIFLSALHSSFGTIKARLEILDRASEVGSPEAMVAQILGLLVDATTLSPELSKLVQIAFLELHGKAEDVCFEYLNPLFTAIDGFLFRNIVKGRLRDLDPAISTAAIVLTVVAQPMLSKLIAGSGISRLNGRESLELYSRFWLNVLIPTTQDRLNSAGPFPEPTESHPLLTRKTTEVSHDAVNAGTALADSSQHRAR
jgi:AcrR family transcriptional regulator